MIPRSTIDGSQIINCGIYAINRGVFERTSIEHYSLETEVLPELISNQSLKAIAYDNYFVDIGVPTDLAAARQHFLGLT